MEEKRDLAYLSTLSRTELEGLKIVEEIDPPGVQQALEGVLLLRQPERVDVAVYRGRVDAPAGDRDRRLIRPAQDQRRERLASVAARGRVRNYVALRVDEVERPNIDDAVADRRREAVADLIVALAHAPPERTNRLRQGMSDV